MTTNTDGNDVPTIDFKFDPVERLRSPTIDLGLKYTVTMFPTSPHTITSLTHTGDIFYGRTGRYTVSFFLTDAVLRKQVMGFTYHQAALNIREVAIKLKTRDAAMLPPPYLQLCTELIEDLESFSRSRDMKLEVMENSAGWFISRWRDIQLHATHLFYETSPENATTADDLRRQLEAIGNLEAAEREATGEDRSQLYAGHPTPPPTPPSKTAVIMAVCSACEAQGASAGKEELLRCSRCKTVFYCDVACQKAHWPTHKGSCKKQLA
ncbi:hypothetical protein HK097_010286 [Rhizophlyctis rosea]|uniref:MYND-type domain-containing protein n=1 Tax=Rhizophlyctis rosea TaxID=64517 RepID=A0AAD5X404_9FUNG|nr:hypothetical protein HK097_010286 [Rhizophlyctis rosea]